MRTPTRQSSRPARISFFGALCLSLAMVLTACAGPSTDESGSESTSGSVVSVEIPNTPVGKTTQRVLDVLNAAADTTVADWDGKLHESFTSAVPLEDFVQLLNEQIRPAQPFTPTDYSGSENESVTRLENPLTDPITLSIVIDGDGLITGLMFTPAESDDWEAPASLSELETRLKEFPATIRALIITEDSVMGGDAALLDMNSEESAPIGSAFKLYVLLAVAEAIAEGELQWDDELEVNDTVRSLPTGELQNEPDGTRVSVREAAGKMISISDNTATDMLIQRLGRERVEAAVVAAGHHDPSQMIPFQTTRELFHIGWGDPELLTAWRDGDVTQRRAVLDSIATQPFNSKLLTLKISVASEAVWPDGAEWFASPRDLARVHFALNAQTDPEIAAILSENPGVATSGWNYVAFKGGSSPGALTGSWLVSDADGRTVVVVMQASTTELSDLGSAQQSEFFRLAQSALELTHDAL